MINLLKGLFSDSNEDEEENIFSKSDDEVPEESENKSENDWEKFSTVEDKEEKSAFEEAREEAKSNEGLKLSESVSSGYANPQDTAKVKYGLNRTGYYNDDISTIPNQKMLDGVKSFQKDNNLRIDGRLNPTGETITAINKKMKEKQMNRNTLNKALFVEKKTKDYSKYGSGFSKEFIDQMEGDKRFQRAMNNYVIKNEGGYVNIKEDRGGETKYGITSKWYPNEDIKNLTRERANAIYYRDYWNYGKINTLPDDIVDIVFDNAVNQGQQTAIEHLQRALNINDDGIIGRETLNKLKESNHTGVKENLKNSIRKRINEIVSKNKDQKKFKKGWLARVNKY